MKAIALIDFKHDRCNMTYQRQRSIAMKRFIPSQYILQEILHYEEETGKIFWKERSARFFENARDCRIWNGRYAGLESFLYTSPHGYKSARIFGKTLMAHRVIWKLKTAEEPNIVDHIDGNRSNNIFTNLRNGDFNTNSKNKGIMKRNTSGYNGISYNKHLKKWETYITSKGITHKLGYFVNLEEAVKARSEADIKFGFHKNHGERLSEYTSKWEMEH